LRSPSRQRIYLTYLNTNYRLQLPRPSPTYCPILSVYTHIHTFSWSSFINMVNKLRIPWTSKSLLIFLTLLGPVKNKGETYVFIFNYTHSTQWGIYVFLRVSVGALVTLLFHSLPFLLVNQNLVFITKGHKNCKVKCKNYSFICYTRYPL